MYVHTHLDAVSPVLFHYYKLCFFRNRDASEVDVEKCGNLIAQNCVMSSEIGNPVAALYFWVYEIVCLIADNFD